MKLDEIKQRGTARQEVLKSLEEQSMHRFNAEKRAGEVVSGVNAQEQKFKGFAAAMVGLAGGRHTAYYDGSRQRVTQSPLIKVSDDTHGALYIGVVEDYRPTGYDGDGGPTGEEFAGYTFTACIGIEMESTTWNKLSYEDQTKAPFKGKTLNYKDVHGLIVDREQCGHATTKEMFVNASEEAIQAYQEAARIRLTNIAETVQLIQTSIVDPDLNPLPAGRDIGSVVRPL